MLRGAALLDNSAPAVYKNPVLRRADTQTPTRKRLPYSTVYECLKALFRQARFEKRTDTLSTIA